MTLKYSPNFSLLKSQLLIVVLLLGATSAFSGIHHIPLDSTGGEPDKPIALSDSVFIGVDQVWDDTLAGIPANGSIQSFNLVSGTSHGSLFFDPSFGAILYEPDSGFVGTDSFSFTVTDDSATSDPAHYVIVVGDSGPPPVPEKPIALSDTGSVSHPDALVDTVQGIPANGTILSYNLVFGPPNGTLFFDSLDGSFVYVPDTTFQGVDFFSFTVTDDSATSNAADYVIIVGADSLPPPSGPEKPIALSDTGSVSHPDALVDTVQGIPANGTILSYNLVFGPPNGTLFFDSLDGSFVYVPDTTFQGVDFFSFTVTDDSATSNAADYVIIVGEDSLPPPGPGKPIALSDTGQVSHPDALVDTLRGIPANGSIQSYNLVNGPFYGELNLDPLSGGFFYVPDTGFFGTDFFQFTVTDDSATSDVAEYVIEVVDSFPGNHPPIDIGVDYAFLFDTDSAPSLVIDFFTIDPDFDFDFTYELVDTDSAGGDSTSGFFQIFGEVMVSTSEFKAEEGTYHFRIRSIDQDGASIEKDFTIEIIECDQFFYINGQPFFSDLNSSPGFQEIGFVTTENGENKIHWVPASSNIDQFNIYRESEIENDYELIGTVEAGGSNIFVDTEAHPEVQSYEYKISASNACAEGPLSPLHKTVHLTVGVGLENSVNLLWNEYMGRPYQSTQIQKREGWWGDWEVLATVSASTTSYTDFDVKKHRRTEYRLQLILGSDIPGDTLFFEARTGSAGSMITSNIVEVGEALGLDDEGSIKLYPNPASDQLTIEGFSRGAELTILHLDGKQVLRSSFREETETFDISALKSGTYFIRIADKDRLVTQKLLVE